MTSIGDGASFQFEIACKTVYSIRIAAAAGGGGEGGWGGDREIRSWTLLLVT